MTFLLASKLLHAIFLIFLCFTDEDKPNLTNMEVTQGEVLGLLDGEQVGLK